jgi:hypothetical protein
MERDDSKPKCFGTYVVGQFAPAYNSVCERSCTHRDECKALFNKWMDGVPVSTVRRGGLVNPDHIKRIYQNGAPYAKIAELLHIEVAYVRETLKSVGVLVREPGPKEKWRDRLAEIKRAAPWGKGRG